MAHAVDLRAGGGLIEAARRLALWLPVLAMAYPLLLWPLLEAPPVVAHADLARAAPDAGGVLNRIFFPPLFLAGLAVFALQVRAGAINLLRPAVVLTVLYVGWAGASVLWGVDPDVVLRRTLLQVTIVGSVLLPSLAARDPQGVLNRMFWLFALTGMLNLAAVALIPAGPIGHQGIYAHKNSLGGVAAMVFLFALLQAASARGFARLIAMAMMAVALVLLVESQSKTSLGLSILIPATAFAVCLVARAWRITPALTVPLGVGGLYLLYLIGVQTYVWDFESVATFIFGDPTLTQRTDIWDFALKMIERRPWLGYGYEAFWGVSFESPSIREAPGFVAKMPHAHNGFIDVIIHTGFIGLGLVLALILATLYDAGRVVRRSMLLGNAMLALILSCLFYNFTETTLFRSFDLQHLVFLMVIGLAASARDLMEAWGDG